MQQLVLLDDGAFLLHQDITTHTIHAVLLGEIGRLLLVHVFFDVTEEMFLVAECTNQIL